MQVRVNTGTMQGIWMVLLALALSTCGKLGEHLGIWVAGFVLPGTVLRHRVPHRGVSERNKAELGLTR